MQEALDAESVRSVMAHFYEAMRTVIEAHDGTLEKFIGDAVVAVFGTPTVREDDALRAVRCAGAMAAALEELNGELQRDWGVRLAMRTGVNTGELVIGQGAGDHRGDANIVVGDVMNTAARLEQAAGAGEVLIGEQTERLVRHEVELEPARELELKGKAQPVRAWRLVAVERASGADDISGETPLIGRSGELGRLRAVLDGAIGARDCRLVTVIGSPGVGKTRLARELARGLGEQAAVVEGHCEPSGEGITLLPIAEVLRSLAGIGEADPADVVREKLGALIADSGERERLIEPLAGVLGISAPASAQETFWALRRGLELVANQRPIVVILDDLHWGQPMFLDLVEHLIEWVSDAPVLLLALARPELREIREALAFPGRRAADVVELSPLDDDESRALVGGLLGGVELPEALAGRILKSSEGNPLFLGEMLRMLVDEGAIRREQQEWVAGSDLASVEVPPTIHALLASRIERLGSEERSVVERAAVIGKEFYRGAVAELVAPPVKPRLDGHLEALRRKDMVEPDGTYWIDEPVYRFHHVLIRDAAYRSLLKEARAELHERFADWLQEKAGELVGEHEEVIAFHLEQAQAYRRQLGPLDARGRALGDRAARRLHSAGRRALAREDLAAAANLLSRALACGAGAEEEMQWDLCEALLSAGDAASARDVVARYDAAAGDDPRRRARAVVLRAELANLSGAEGAEASAEAAAGAAQTLAELEDRESEAKAWQVAAGTYARLGQVGAVEQALDRALAAARAADDRRRATAVLARAPRAALWGPSPVVRASGRCLDVVRILRMTPGNRHVEAIALRCQAVLEAMRGRIEAAREILAAGRATLEELGLALELHETAVHAGIVELLAGDPKAAVEQLRAAREGFQSLGVSSGAAQAAALLARSLIEQGDHDGEAIEQTRFAEEHAGEDLKTTITWCSARAQALARSGEDEEGLSLARRAVALAEPTDALADKADAAMALASVLLAAGRAPEARQAAAAARDLYEAKGHTLGAQSAARVAEPDARSATHEAGGARRPPETAPAGTPGRAALGDRAPERFWAEFQRLANERDYDAMSPLIAPDLAWADHRALGWEEAHGREQTMSVLRSTFGASPDLRLDFDEVLACDERVIAVRMAWRGRGVKAGELELAAGAVLIVEDGLWMSVDFYEPEDRAAILARYAELGRRRAVLGDRPPERWYSEYARRVAAHDLARCLELYAHHHVMTDHRALGWEPVRGRQSIGEVLGSAFVSVPDIEHFTDEVLACDERVIAVRAMWRGHALDGGGAAELPMGIVNVVEDGLLVSTDHYDYDDDTAMLARYAELGGRERRAGRHADPDGQRAMAEAPAPRRSDAQRPPERVQAEYRRLVAAKDLDRLLDLYTEDVQLVDHRTLAWEEVHDRASLAEAIRSAFAIAEQRIEVDEVLACDDRVIASRDAWRGRATDGGGYVERAQGTVTVISDGRIASRDIYEPDDRQSMIARYAELGGGQGTLGDRPPERFYAEFVRRFARRDLDRLADLWAEDWRFVDHRLLAWEEQVGRDTGMAGLRSALEGSLDLRVEVDEVLACDDRVIAFVCSWRGHTLTGGGELEMQFGTVMVIEHGQGVSADQYDPGERQAMLARYAELGGQRALAGEHAPERLWAECARYANARDYERVLDFLAEDCRWIDHRPLGWETARGRVPCVDVMRSTFGAAPDVRMECEEVLACDERALAVRLAWRGAGVKAGDWEVQVGAVADFMGGKWRSTDFYEPDDREAMLARFAELSGERQEPRVSPPEAWFAEFGRRWDAHDLDGLLELYADDWVLTDRRTLALWGQVKGREAQAALNASVLAVSPDTSFELDEVLACDQRLIAVRGKWLGSGPDGGGESTVDVGGVWVIESGLAVSGDVYELDDRQAIIARYVELGGGLEGFGDRPPERLLAEYARRYARFTQEPEPYLELHCDDFSMIDRRELALWEEVRGRDGAGAIARSAFAATADLRLEVDEVLVCDDCVIALRGSFRGHALDGGGEVEVPMGSVVVLEDGLLKRIEQHEPEDSEGMLARYRELGGTG